MTEEWWNRCSEKHEESDLWWTFVIDIILLPTCSIYWQFLYHYWLRMRKMSRCRKLKPEEIWHISNLYKICTSIIFIDSSVSWSVLFSVILSLLAWSFTKTCIDKLTTCNWKIFWWAVQKQCFFLMPRGKILLTATLITIEQWAVFSSGSCSEIISRKI
jgi:hypothetical protein